MGHIYTSVIPEVNLGFYFSEETIGASLTETLIMGDAE